MLFEVTTSGTHYTPKDAKKLQVAFGFQFEPTKLYDYRFLKHHGAKGEVEIASLEELIRFTDTWGEVIVSDGKLRIYDERE